VDRALGLMMQASPVPVLVNFGGDLRVSGPRGDGARWRVLIEAVEQGSGAAWLEINTGAITTSGDARRYVERDGGVSATFSIPHGYADQRRAACGDRGGGHLHRGGGAFHAGHVAGRGQKLLKAEGVQAWVAR
jgi:thiamine biosynthesis lipoprotein